MLVKKASGVSHEEMVHDPAASFGSPDELVQYPELTPAQKIDMLQRWRWDVQALSESATGGGEALLGRIIAALRTLGVGDGDPEGVAPVEPSAGALISPQTDVPTFDAAALDTEPIDPAVDGEPAT